MGIQSACLLRSKIKATFVSAYYSTNITSGKASKGEIQADAFQTNLYRFCKILKFLVDNCLG